MYTKKMPDQKGKALSVENFEVSSSIIAREHRMIFLKGLIVGWPAGAPGRQDIFSPSQVFMDILAMNYDDPAKPITLVVNSEGGLVDTGMQLYDTIRLSKAPVRTIGINCASMATLLLAAGSERLAFPHGRFMLHLLGGRSAGDIKELESQVREARKTQEMITDCYVDCGLTAGLKIDDKKKIRGKLLKDIDDGDFWLSAEEAVAYGLVDRIATTEELFS